MRGPRTGAPRNHQRREKGRLRAVLRASYFPMLPRALAPFLLLTSAIVGCSSEAIDQGGTSGAGQGGTGLTAGKGGGSATGGGGTGGSNATGGSSGTAPIDIP